MEILKRLIVSVALLLGLAAGAADLQRGITFTDGQVLTASDLHQLIDSATIVPGFLSGKPVATSLAGGDLLLLYSGGTLYQISGNSLLYANSALITGRSEKGVPIAADYLLLWDSVSQTLEKVSAGNLALSSTNLYNLADLWPSNASLGTFLPALNTSTNNRLSVSNLFALFTYSQLFTNLAAYTAPTNLDELLIYDSKNGLNKQTTLIGLITNLPTVATYTNTADVLFGVSYANPAVPKVVKIGGTAFIAGLEGNGAIGVGGGSGVLADISYLPIGTNFQVALTTGNVIVTNFAIALPTGPTFRQYHVWATLVCTNAELGYSVGDEVDSALFQDGSQNNAFAVGLNASTFYATCSSATLKVINKGSTTRSSITDGNWNLKIYFEAFFR
jgi:hypothetical protein